MQAGTSVWFDGHCRKCGHPVIEMSSHGEKDYQNTCTNGSCENATWHYCYDDEELDYYKHDSSCDGTPRRA